jgi:hypothetical protein
MRKLLIILSFILLQNCSKPKTALICGDHICVNKSEAEQYFEENLSIEVKIIDKKKNKDLDLVELNMLNNTNEKRQISIKNKKNTNEVVKVLTNDEIKKIKRDIKKKNQKKKTVRKIPKNIKKKEKKVTNKDIVIKKNKNINKELINKSTTKKRVKVVDVCSIIEECNIDEISKFLLKEGKKKNYPDITTKE